MKHDPEINLNIEIHSQFAPFPLDILRRGLLVAASGAAGRRPGVVSGKGMDHARCRIPGLTICPTADRRGSANRKTCKPRVRWGPRAAPWPIC